jgi:CDGSH-type Zn-finger protein
VAQTDGPNDSKRKSIMATPLRASNTPFVVNAEAGKDYWWCSCGQAKAQPFCDGSHEGSTFTPVKYHAETSKQEYFCGCKATGKAPLCDGSHKQAV